MESDYTFLKLRVFGTSECENCKMLQKSLNHYGLGFDFIDANDPKNDKLCDFFDVDEMPLLQVLDSRNNAVIAFHAGLVDPMKMLKKAGFLISKRDEQKPYNLAKTNKSNRCKNCYD